MALWSGRFTEDVSEFTQRFGASLPVDKQLYAQDIAGSKAHARMLGMQGVISNDDVEAIVDGLDRIQERIEAGDFDFDIKAYEKLDKMSSIKDGFVAVMQFLEILNILAHSEGARTLATSSYAKVQVEDDSRRILKVKDYIIKNYPYELKLQTLADIASMSQSAFSRFFKLHTGRTLSDYIIDIRLGYATRMLLDTNDTIADISFKCGYNNLSNFNRTFRRKKGCTPREFRENFRKIRIIV